MRCRKGVSHILWKPLRLSGRVKVVRIEVWKKWTSYENKQGSSKLKKIVLNT